ncbi:MAG: hypothetical protein AAGH92_08055 [Planctomycetota bacterium]
MSLMVTEAARDELLNMLEEAEVPDASAARFVIDGKSLRLTISRRKRGDAKVEHAGRTVLVLGPKVARLLDNHQLDKVETDEGYGLSLTERDQLADDFEFDGPDEPEDDLDNDISF